MGADGVPHILQEGMKWIFTEEMLEQSLVVEGTVKVTTETRGYAPRNQRGHHAPGNIKSMG